MSEAKADFKTKLSEIIETFENSLNPDTAPFAGGAAGMPLEHTTRIHFLDEVIKALGWELGDVVEEARIKTDTTSFIDYLGVSEEMREPVLIVEAKAWSMDFIRAKPESRRANLTDAGLLNETIACIRDGRDNYPVVKDWYEWLLQVHGYVKDLNISGHDVGRVVITSGQWLLVFINPVATFCDGRVVSERDFNVFHLKDNGFVEASDCIFDLLAKIQLTASIPEFIRPTQLTSYISADLIRSAFFSVMVVREKSGHSFYGPDPVIQIYPSLLLVRDDGTILNVAAGRQDKCTLPDDPKDLPDHFARVNQRAEALLVRASQELRADIEIRPIADFPGFRVASGTSAMTPGGPIQIAETSYVRPNARTAGEFLVATGMNRHFLLRNNIVENCKYHDWKVCFDLKQAVGGSAIFSRSIDKKSYFMSTENHHCPHTVIHDRRVGRCKISVFEKYLCCMACSFEEVCWPAAELATLPCSR